MKPGRGLPVSPLGQYSSKLQNVGQEIETRPQSPCLNLILPVFKVVKFFNFSPDSFTYDDSGAISYNKAPKWLKVLSFVQGLFLFIHVIGLSRLMVEQIKGKLRILYHVISVGYVTYHGVWAFAAFHKYPRIHKILLLIQEFQGKFELFNSGQIFTANQVRYKKAGWFLVLLYISIAISYTLILRCGFVILLNQGLTPFIQNVVKVAYQELSLLAHSNLTVGYDPAKLSSVGNVGIALSYFVLSILYEMSWVLGFLQTFVWGIIFQGLFHNFCTLVSNNQSQQGSSLKDIRTFISLTFILEEFNKVFGGHILTSAIAGSLHFSIFVLTLFSISGQPLEFSMTVCAFVMFFLQLFSAARVSSSAHYIGKVLKRRFHDEETWKGKEAGNSEMIQGMLVVYNELQSGNIGFQGLGFFTITYSFIGSVLSVIATYSVLALQFGASGRVTSE